jgi:hypothetical protein
MSSATATKKKRSSSSVAATTTTTTTTTTTKSTAAGDKEAGAPVATANVAAKSVAGGVDKEDEDEVVAPTRKKQKTKKARVSKAVEQDEDEEGGLVVDDGDDESEDAGVRKKKANRQPLWLKKPAVLVAAPVALTRGRTVDGLVIDSVAEHYFDILPVGLWNELLHFDVDNEFGVWNVRAALGLVFNLSLVSKKMCAVMRNLDDSVFGGMYHVLCTKARTVSFDDPLRQHSELANAAMRAKLQHVMANHCFCCMAPLKVRLDNDCFDVWRVRLCLEHINSETVGKTVALQSTMVTDSALQLLNSAKLNKGARSRRYLRHQVRNYELLRFGGSSASLEEAKNARQRAAAVRRNRHTVHFDMFHQIALLMANAANVPLFGNYDDGYGGYDSYDDEMGSGGMCPDCGEYH